MKKTKIFYVVIYSVLVIRFYIFAIKIKSLLNFLVKINYKKLLTGASILLIIGLVIKIGVYGIVAHNCQNIFFSFLLMFFISLAIRYVLIKIYDHRKKDDILIEGIKAKRENKESNYVKERIEKLERRGHKFLKYGLMVFDPIVAAIYLRPGYDKWNGLPDYETRIIFIASNAICCLIWGTIMTGSVKIF